MSAQFSKITSALGWLALASIVLVAAASAYRAREAAQPPPLARATELNGKPARYDTETGRWVLTDEKDLTVVEEGGAK